MKKLLICIVLLLCAFHLPVSADGLRENEIINIGVIVNNDNSIEIIASTTKKQLAPHGHSSFLKRTMIRNRLLQFLQ